MTHAAKLLTRHTSIEGSDCSPFTSTLLTSLIKNLAYEGLTIVILELEDVGGDVDQERVKNTLVPLEEDVSDLVVADLETALEDVICLCDQLHVAVLDTWGYDVSVIRPTTSEEGRKPL